jgi:putative phosphoribosyl transferase
MLLRFPVIPAIFGLESVTQRGRRAICLERVTERLAPMGSPDPGPSPRSNLLLAALSNEERERVTPLLRLVQMKRDQAIYHPGGSIPFLYFPLTVVLSLVGALSDGSGSSRHSLRNRHVAWLLNEAKLATLLIDLLTSDEEASDRWTAHLRFDIGLLATRLVGATDWLTQYPDTRTLRVGYFGASTGAGAALVAAAERPDLAGSALARVRAPTLLIVGGNDAPVIELNRAALKRLHCEKQLVIIPGATHLFEEPGALDEVARLTREWFERYLISTEGRATGVSIPEA